MATRVVKKPAKTDIDKAKSLPRKLIAPALIFSLALTQIPFLVTIYFSFMRWNLLKPQEKAFAGFENYIHVFKTGDLLPAITATVGLTAFSVICSLLVGLGFAVLLDRKFKGQSIVRTLIITPFLIMPAASALIWKFSMFDTNIGIINFVAQKLGFDAIGWSTQYPYLSVIILLTWQFAPFMMLILLSGLQSQSKEVLEAASVDRAGAWRTFTLITLPHLRQYIEVAVLLGTIMLLQAFDPVAIMTKGTGGTKTLAYLLYERAFVGMNVGQAAAYGVVTVILTIIVATISLRSLFKVFISGVNK
jgi:sorbitol/mannitol transport system permease protein